MYLSRQDATTVALTQASATWWHSSGTLRTPGCTRPQLHRGEKKHPVSDGAATNGAIFQAQLDLK